MLNRRTFYIGLVTLGLLMLTTGIVSANWIAHEQRTYLDDDNCVIVRSEISHGSGGGYSKTTVRSKGHNPYECASRKARFGGNIKAKWKLLYQTYGGWSTCRYSNYVYNSSRVDTFSAYHDHGPNVRCGETNYMNVSNGGVNIGGWKGLTSVYPSPGHHLP